MDLKEADQEGRRGAVMNSGIFTNLEFRLIILLLKVVRHIGSLETGNSVLQPVAKVE